MYSVYVIKSRCRNYIYVGLSGNVRVRISQHNNKQNKTTKPYAPFDILLIEEYSSRIEARVREKYLKSGIGKEFLKTLL